jgi:hypothetical protein
MLGFTGHRSPKKFQTLKSSHGLTENPAALYQVLRNRPMTDLLCHSNRPSWIRSCLRFCKSLLPHPRPRR